ncbi:Trehalose 2-sulfotransferase [Alphaproteobacteria bacterium SO-S41]|nr:Trehalose 2-sulfotransferase [Alphaproteobacteria bacterium SO-S41]
MNDSRDGGFAPLPATNDQFGAAHDYPLFVGRPRVYLIASAPRTGSHFLGDLLGQCGDLGRPFEYLNLARRKQWTDSTGTSNLADALSRLAQRRTSPSGWFGCKAHWSDFSDAITDPRVEAFLRAPSYIHIWRREKLAQAISFVVAVQTNSWRSFQQPACEPVYDRPAIASALEDLTRQEACWRDYFAARAIEPLTICYEELIARPQQWIDAVRHHLGAPERNINPSETAVKPQATRLNDDWRRRYESGS